MREKIIAQIEQYLLFKISDQDKDNILNLVEEIYYKNKDSKGGF